MRSQVQVREQALATSSSSLLVPSGPTQAQPQRKHFHLTMVYCQVHPTQ